MSRSWAGWLAFAVLAFVVAVSSCQAAEPAVLPAISEAAR
jgi:hypothetical protein